MKILVLGASFPASVEIVAEEVGPVVAGCHSVRVDHWNYLDLVLFSKIFGLFVLGQEEVNESFANERAWSFTRVLSGYDKN